MATWRDPPWQTKPFAVNAAILLSLALLAGPAQAIKSDAVPCPKSEPATLQVSFQEMVTSVVSSDIPLLDKATDLDKFSSALTLLAPQAEAAIREAFRVKDVSVPTNLLASPMVDSDSSNDADTKNPDVNANDSGMNTRLPGVSDDDLSRYKKQMFRRDI